MEEVRSYWQVAGISHFCNIFGKQFKLPTFEPEELEQAFILNIPDPPNNNNSNNINTNDLHNSNNNNNNDNHNHDHTEGLTDENNRRQNSPPIAEENEVSFSNNNDDPDYLPARRSLNQQHLNEISQQQQQEKEEPQAPELHLLVKLAIALLKPHFNTKLSHSNWETYLKRIVESNWVELEHHPSPFRVPLITEDGVELTKNLTFNELPLSDKIELFYALCDYRLWSEDAAEAIKDYTLETLRMESIGKDSQGYEYWYFSGTRLFRENKELSQDLILRKKRIKELEYNLIELERLRIFREQEEKRKTELERTRQLAAEAREARLAAKKQQEQEAQSKRRKLATPTLPPRTGLRERRSSATSNNNSYSQQKSEQKQPQQQSPPQQARTTRSRQAKTQEEPQQTPTETATPTPKKTRSSLAKNSKHNNNIKKESPSPEEPKKSPEEECKAELERLIITQEDRFEAWHMQCDSLESWESFATKFEKTKSINEKYLSSYVNEELLPKIRAIYAKRAAEIRRKEKELLFSLSSRRVSTRIISKRTQEEEEEKQAQIREAEMRRKKVEAEARLRAELEREMRVRQNRFVINGGGTSSNCSDEDGNEDVNGRYNLRQPIISNGNEFDGIIHPDNLSDFYEAIELVIDTVRISKHAWPFIDPVPNTVPGYYDLIKEPMDLRTLRTRIEFREYKSLIELEKDFQLLVNNCERFNGPKNIYTKMVYKLWKSFKKNVQLYLERDLYMDEYETFVYPPVRPAEQTSLEAVATEVAESTSPINRDPIPEEEDEEDEVFSSESSPTSSPSPSPAPCPVVNMETMTTESSSHNPVLEETVIEETPTTIKADPSPSPVPGPAVIMETMTTFEADPSSSPVPSPAVIVEAKTTFEDVSMNTLNNISTMDWQAGQLARCDDETSKIKLEFAAEKQSSPADPPQLANPEAQLT